MAGPMLARIEAIRELEDIVQLLAACGLPVADISPARSPQFSGLCPASSAFLSKSVAGLTNYSTGSAQKAAQVAQFKP